MLRSNQGGSILSFVIIGGILTALLIGGAYFVQQQSVRSEERPVAISQEPAPAPKVPTGKEPVKADKEATPKPVTPPAPTPQKPSAPQKPASPQRPATPAPKANQSKDEGPIVTTPPPQTAKQLPKTGPVQTISALLGVGLLTSATIAYVHSRRV